MSLSKLATGDDDYESYRKQLIASRKGVAFNREVRGSEIFEKLDRSQIDIVDPDEHEQEHEDTEVVPMGVEAEEDGFWAFRIRSDLPKKYHNRAIVHVSMI